MFSFFRIKSYKRTFLTLFIAMGVISVMVFLMTSWLLIDRQRELSHTAAVEESLRFEETLSSYEMAADNLLKKIQNLKPLADDLALFLQSSTSADYYQNRAPSNVSNGLTIENAVDVFFTHPSCVFSEVVFISEKSTNRILPGKGNDVICVFGADEEGPIDTYDVFTENAVVFTKNIYADGDAGKKIGVIRFIAPFDNLFSSLRENHAFTGIRLTAPSGIYDIVPPKTAIPEIDYSLLPSSGTVAAGNGQSVFYHVFHSRGYGCTLFFSNTLSDFLRYSFSSFLVLSFIIIPLYGTAMLTVTLRLRQNYLHLNVLLDRIKHIQNGDLKHTVPANGIDMFALLQNALNEMSGEIDRHIEREYVLKLEQQKAEMAALEHQINPHFLYNTLEIIRSKAFLSGSPEVSDAIFHLGSLYRSIVKSPSVLPFADEIALLESYLKIMEYRFSDNFYYKIDIPEEIRRLDTVKLWMQPLAENFFAHGFSHDDPYNLLLVTGEVSEQYYMVSFIDNGKQSPTKTTGDLNRSLCTKESAPETGAIGMKNVSGRLRRFYGEELQMTIKNNDTDGVTITVRIPRRE